MYGCTGFNLVLHLCRSHASQGDLSSQQVKLASKKDASLAKLPPCEKSFLQHVQRASWQTKVWTHSHIPCPDIGSPLGHGWQPDGAPIVPILYESPMASELLQDSFAAALPNSSVDQDVCAAANICPVQIYAHVVIRNAKIRTIFCNKTLMKQQRNVALMEMIETEWVRSVYSDHISYYDESSPKTRGLLLPQIFITGSTAELKLC